MKLRDLCAYLDTQVPLAFQEDYDNSGLQAGSPEKDISSALVTIDVTEDVVKEAISNNCDVIVSHHPVLFHGLKSLTGRTSTEKILIEAVKHDISIYSAHTNLDIIKNGVSWKIANKLGLGDVKVLSPLENRLLKLVTYIPETHFEKVSNSIFEAGAGVIGNYDQCGFAVAGTGSFRGNESTNPFRGEKSKLHFETEIRFETILFSHQEKKVIRALLESHPYEEVAYDLYRLENRNAEIGLGCTGVLPTPLGETEFLECVSALFGSRGLRYSQLMNRTVHKIAVCGGSGASLINEAIASGSDVYLTADLKYHDYFKAENKILLIDPGHFESEKFTTEILKDLIIKKFPKFAVRFSETVTNPINYF